MKNQRWFIVSNIENIKYFFYVNLIVDAQGFPRNSYNTDMQTAAPAGYLLCCNQEMLPAAIQAARAEDQNLAIAILELDFKNLTIENYFYKDSNANIYNAQLQAISKSSAAPTTKQTINPVELLLPAPLPLQVIKTIFVADLTAERELQLEFAADIGNIEPIKFKTDKRLFASSDNDFLAATFLQSEYSEVAPRVLDYNKAFAYSGALALSFYQSKNGVESEQMFTALAENNLDNYPNLQNLFSWTATKAFKTNEAQLYCLILDAIANETDHGIIKFIIMNLLKQSDNLPEQLRYIHKFADRLEAINNRTTEKNDYDTFTDMFGAGHQDAKWALKIFLLLSMVFWRDNNRTMLKYYHQQFCQQDYILLAVFYGFIFGIGKVPREIININKLRNWLSSKTAIFMHANYQSQFSCDKLPPAPAFLRSKYLYDSTANKVQDNFIKFCKLLKIDETQVSTWQLRTPAEYTTKGNAINFSKRPTIKLIIDSAKLDATICELIGSDELFDFNACYNLFGN